MSAGAGQVDLPGLAVMGNIDPHFRRTRPAAFARQRRILPVGTRFPRQADAVGTDPIGIKT